jgi:hypothetical protein
VTTPEFLNPGAVALEGAWLSIALRFAFVNQAGVGNSSMQFDLGAPCLDGDLIVVDFGVAQGNNTQLAAARVGFIIGDTPRPYNRVAVVEGSNNVTLWRFFTRAQAGDQFITLSVPTSQTLEVVAGAWRIPNVIDGAQDNQPLNGHSGPPPDLAAFTDQGPGVALGFVISTGFNTQPDQPDDWRIQDWASQGAIVGVAYAHTLTGAGPIAQANMTNGNSFGWCSLVTPLYNPGHVILGAARGFTNGLGIGTIGVGPTEARRTPQPGDDPQVPMPPSTEPDPPTEAHRSGQYPT